MAHMGCDCGADMWDGDGHIVYDIFSFKDLKEYIADDDTKTFDDAYEEMVPFYEDNDYFWLCDDCKTVHLWSYKPEYCYRKFKLKKSLDKVSVDEIKKLNEYLIMNINEYTDEFDETPIKDLLKKNPVSPYKYYVTDDLTKVYIINIEENKIDREYELTYESFVEYNWEPENVGNLLIHTIDKKNKGYEYIVENGIRRQQDTDDYPHKQVNFMIREKGSGKGSISYADPNKKPEIYTINTMDEFKKKYGKYYKAKENKKYKYVYVEYDDDFGDKLYCYLDNDKNVEKGDRVLVDRAGSNATARVVNIVEYKLSEVPYPVEQTKNIIKVVDEDFEVDEFKDYESEEKDENMSEKEIKEKSPYDKFKNKISIFNSIEKNIQKNGTLSDKFKLDDYLIDDNGVKFAPGAVDNVFPSGKDEDFLDYFKNLLSLLEEDTEQLNGNLTDKYLYENKNVRVLGNIDIITDYIRDNTDKIKAANLYNYAIYLMLCCRNPEAVKLGIGLLSLFPIESTDKIVEALEKLSLCDEFTFFTNFVFKGLDNVNDIRFKLAKKVSGWGKINLVTDLEPTNEKIKEWLITNGVENEVMYSYLAYPITQKVDIIKVLNKKDISNDEISGIIKIIDGLLDEGPVEGISKFEKKKELFESYFKLHIKFNNDMSYNLTLLDILNYLNHEKGLKVLQKDILNYFESDEFLEVIKNIISKTDLLDKADIRRFNQACYMLDRIHNDSFNEIIYNSLKINSYIMTSGIELLLKDKKYNDKAIEIINSYDFSNYYGDPLPEIVFDDMTGDLIQLIQLLANYPFSSEKIIIDGLKCKYMHPRHSAILAIKKWLNIRNNKYTDLPKKLKDALEELHNKEIVKDYKLEINSIMGIKEDLSKYEAPKVIYSSSDNLFDLFDGNLNELFTDLIIIRGKEYYKDSMVYNCVKTNNKYTAYVQGSDFDKEYIVEIDCDGEKIVNMTCSCPYESNCKHEYAAIMYIRDNYHK